MNLFSRITGATTGLFTGIVAGISLSASALRNGIGGIIPTTGRMEFIPKALLAGAVIGVVHGYRNGFKASLAIPAMASQLITYLEHASDITLAMALFQKMLTQQVDAEKKLLITKISAPQQSIKLLTNEEVEAFKLALKDMKADEKLSLSKRLDKYLEYSANTCHITLAPMDELAEPVTLEGTFGSDAKKSRNWIKTYERAALIRYIESKPRNVIVLEPATHDDIADEKHVQAYTGFPKEIIELVNLVRKTNQEVKVNDLRHDQKDLAEAPASAVARDNSELRTLRLQYYDPRLHPAARAPQAQPQATAAPSSPLSLSR